MTPLHLAPNITLLHGDCLEYMATLADGAYSLCVVDPPYGLNLASEKPRKSGRWDYGDGGQKQWDKKPSCDYFQQLSRISKNQIVWGGNYFSDMLPPSRGWIVWDKLQPVDNFADAELAWTSFDAVISTFRLSFAANKNKIHINQKPVALYRFILQNYARPGDTILDTHLGSGSSAIAAWEMGYTFTGIEIDRDYFDAAVERIKKRMSQPYLPGIVQPKPEQTSLF